MMIGISPYICKGGVNLRPFETDTVTGPDTERCLEAVSGPVTVSVSNRNAVNLRLSHTFATLSWMKPEDLKPPTCWEDRHVLIRDRVWYVPKYYQDYNAYTFPGWQSPELFGNAHAVVVEYCSGNGTWVAAKAAQQPQVNWVAVEKRFQRARKIWSKIKNQQLSNLIALCGEGYTATRHYFPSISVDEVYINFPDPWPKTKHAKHRLIDTAFLQELYRILKPRGVVTIVTDDAAYSEGIIAEFAQYQGFEMGFPSPYYVTDLPGYGASYFGELWREKGREIRHHRFQKQ